ncbi:MAG: leucyl/phenylalanyl-tRNA--protein transferase [Betaproteobacteria bacterium]|nr:leucyl/phenylalanyl-tRNA--protein transferase [Betaproteobacteria bacterium]
MIDWLSAPSAFPPPARALDDPNGLLCAGGDLTPDSIVKAYAGGIFPWYSEGQPILWWSPDPRMVLYPAEFKLSRSLAKTLRAGRFEVRFDTAFADVIRACAEPRREDGGTWIVPAMQEAYIALHRAGIAHCAEAWRDGRLVGGLYGVALGRVFFGESMFARETDASKVAFASLMEKIKREGFELVDCQQETAHLARFGARPIPRAAFLRHLAQLINSPVKPGQDSSRWNSKA